MSYLKVGAILRGPAEDHQQRLEEHEERGLLRFSANDRLLRSSAELEGLGKLLRFRPGIVDLETKVASKPGETKPEMPWGRAHKPAHTDSDRFRNGLGVSPPRSKTV